MTHPVARWLCVSAYVCVGRVHRPVLTSRIPAGVCVNNPEGSAKRTSGGCITCALTHSLSDCYVTKFGCVAYYGRKKSSYEFPLHLISLHFNNFISIFDIFLNFSNWL